MKMSFRISGPLLAAQDFAEPILDGGPFRAQQRPSFRLRNLTFLIDLSEEYTQRAVAHSVPVNSFGHIIGHFETVLGKQLRPLLAQAIDRWAVEIKGEPREPIIRDYDKLAEHLTHLFELRHILCHELPSKPVYEHKEVDEFLDCAIQFTKALQEVLTFEQFGLTPPTQTEMNIQARERLLKAEEQMSAILSQLRSHVMRNDYAATVPAPGKWEGTWVSCLDDAQGKWLLYRDAQCEFETYLNRGGTIRSMIWGSVAEKLTKDRIAELKASWERVKQVWGEGVTFPSRLTVGNGICETERASTVVCVLNVC